MHPLSETAMDMVRGADKARYYHVFTKLFAQKAIHQSPKDLIANLEWLINSTISHTQIVD